MLNDEARHATEVWENSDGFGRMRQSLGGRRVAPVSAAPYAPSTHEGEDDAREWRRSAGSAWTALLKYRDVKGQVSERMVTCQHVKGFGGLTNVMAFCHERQALREFRIDRMIELACAMTGEVFDPQERFEQLQREGAIGVEDKALTELARVMVFMARCDGAYHPLEQAALEHQIERYVLRFGGDDRMIEKAIAGCGEIAPDSEDLIRGVKRFSRAANGAQLCRFVLDAGGAIVDSDGRHAPEEVRWAIEISSALKGICDRAER